jgi:hypothetical protein
MRTVWRFIREAAYVAVLGALAAYWGYQLGYGRGVRTMVDLMVALRSVDEPPPPFQKGGI